MVKTKNKIFMAILFVLVLVPCMFLLVGCNEEPETSIYGRYEAVGYRTVYEQEGVIERSEDNFVLEDIDVGSYVILNENGTAVAGTSDAQPGDDDYSEFEYKIIDNQLLYKADGMVEYLNYDFLENGNLFLLQVVWGPQEGGYDYDGNIYVYTIFSYVEM